MNEQKVEKAAETVAVTVKDMLHLDDISKYVTWANLAKIATSIFALILFYIIYKIIKSLVKKQTKAKLQPHTYMLINKFITYAFWLLITMYVLGLFGINLKAIWGAAGVAGIAIGFAAQTSVSNLISGIFVLSEKAMKVGDFITVGGESGIVDSVGLLSVKIHTLDNQMIRIPNSTIINSNLMNYNSFDKRRFVFDIPVSYDSDMKKALECIQSIPAKCPSVLADPAPAVFYDGFGDGINIKMAVWFNSSDLIKVKNEVYTEIVNSCREQNVEIPYTHYDVKILKD